MSVETFKNKEDAENRKEELIQNLIRCQTVGSRYCPLGRGACVTNCVCFQMPHVGGNQQGGYNSEPSTEFYVYDHYCSNEMFYKEETNVNCRQC